MGNGELQRWIEHCTRDLDLRAELLELAENADREELDARFSGALEFGTGGLRGVMGAGSARMNVYTVAKATQGLAKYLKDNYGKASAAIAYDSRLKSRDFAMEAASVLAANGVSVWIYPRLTPTPALSFAVRELGCQAGVCITASHNPAEYNGYKVYGPDGCQITIEAANEIEREINAADIFEDVLYADFDKAVDGGVIRFIGEDIVESYLEAVLKQSTNEACGGLRVVYTPLNGAGRECVTRILERIGVGKVAVVPEQSEPDGSFPTCPYPNPEEKEALKLGAELCDKLGFDLLLATDPDCDRVGVAVRHGGELQRLNGNEVGILLLDYIAERRARSKAMPENPVAVKTIVTSDMAEAVAQAYGVELRSTLTGFKFIGEQIGMLEQKHEENRFIFGFEESCGYLAGSYVRDKDGVLAAMLICEMAASYARKGMTLMDALEKLYQAHGYYQSALHSISVDNVAEGKLILDKLRENPPQSLCGEAVVQVVNYLSDDTGLPRSDVFEIRTENKSKAIIRPSGTEPKVKLYLSAAAKSKEDAQNKLAMMKEFFGGYLR